MAGPFRVELITEDGNDHGYEVSGPFFHVTNAENRESIRQHGLDWRRMGRHVGIAGSRTPELAGIWLCELEDLVDWFAGFARNRGIPAVDVWEVSLISEPLVHDACGHIYSREPIPAERVALLRTITF